MYNIKHTVYRYVCDNKFGMVVNSGGWRKMGLEGTGSFGSFYNISCLRLISEILHIPYIILYAL